MHISGMPPLLTRVFDVPAAARARLESWGQEFRAKVDKARGEWLLSLGIREFRSLQTRRFRIGTDCSGADAPVWALRAMQVPHEHIFSCDNDKDAEAFIRAASPPRIFFSDMLKRPTSAIPEVDIYVCGFPCTPFSTLRGHSTRLFGEAAAKPYFAMLRVLRDRRPSLAILENVIGINRVMAKVLRDLERLRWYHVLVLLIDPQHFGEPVSRPRYYFVLVRRDACVSHDTVELSSFCRRCMGVLGVPVTAHAKSLMLSNNDPHVQDQLRKIFRAKSLRVARGSGTKWQAKHALARSAQVPTFRNVSNRPSSSARVQGFRSVPTMPLSSARQQEVWQMTSAGRSAADVIVDVTQSIDRVHPRTDGVCPTITPRGIICVGALGRPVLPCEKLLLHGFPLHRMKVPRNISERGLGKLGGNTMHLKSIGSAILLGTSLLRDPLPKPSGGADPPRGVVKAVFVNRSPKGSRKLVESNALGPAGKRPRR